MERAERPIRGQTRIWIGLLPLSSHDIIGANVIVSNHSSASQRTVSRLTLPTLLFGLGVLRGFERSHSKRSLVKDTEHQERGCGASPNPTFWDGFLRCEKLMIEQSQQSVIDTSVISMTSAAMDKVRELLKQENDPSLGLRIFVAGGGCSGLQYGMTLDEEQEGDSIVSVGDFKVFVDDMSLGYITGSEVDYVDSLMGAGFTVNNPNAVSSCGCGHSFKTAQDSGEAHGCGCSH